MNFVNKYYESKIITIYLFGILNDQFVEHYYLFENVNIINLKFYFNIFYNFLIIYFLIKMNYHAKFIYFVKIFYVNRLSIN